MKLELEDNTQEAFQFLMLGAAIVLVIRALVGGIGLLLESGTASEIAEVTSVFRNDFLLWEKNTIVIGGMGVFGRLAMAFLFTIAFGTLSGSFGWVIARLSNRPAIPIAVAFVRFGLLMAGSIAVYSALFLPPRSVVLNEQGALFRDRSGIGEVLALPFTARETFIPWNEVEKIDRTEVATDQGCGSKDRVLLVLDGTDRILTEGTPEGSDCMDAIAITRQRSQRLVEVLDRTYLQQEDLP